MARSKPNKTYFEQTEDQILEIRVPKQREKMNSLDFQYVNGKLNRTMGRKNIRNRKTKKIQTYREDQENQWTYVHETIMLEMVSQGSNWSQIAKTQIYRECGFKNTFIKKQFETCQRMKIRALTNYFLNSFSKQISDKTLKIMINRQELSELRMKEVLTEEEYDILLTNKPFLMECRMDENNKKKCLRKKQSKQKYFNKFSITMDVGIVLSLTILKIDNFIAGIESQDWRPVAQRNEDQVQKQEIMLQTNIDEIDRIDEENCLEVECEELFEEENQDCYQFNSFEPFSRISLDWQDFELDCKIGSILQNI